MSSLDERPPCHACKGTRVQRMTWAIRILPNEPRHEAPLTYECQTCGNVWRVQATPHRPEPLRSTAA